ncbi:unnamed protein product [Ixodes hexagonus]
MLRDMMSSLAAPGHKSWEAAAADARLCRTMRPLLSRTSLSGRTNTPYLGLHSKYLTPLTEPSLRPVEETEVLGSTPTQSPGEN